MKLVQSESLRHIKGYTLVHRTRPLPSRITLPDLTSLCVRINWYTTCDHALKVSKVDMSNLVPSLNHTPIFEWYVVKCGFGNKLKKQRPMLNHICVWLGPASSTSPSLPIILSAFLWEFFPVGTNVTLPGHLSNQAPLACERVPSINVMSTWLFVILTGYYHIGSQRGRVPTQVRVDWLDNEGGVARAGPTEWRCDLGRGLMLLHV
jgi:hypothetical protein